MPAHMADLPDVPSPAFLDNGLRHLAALTIADRCPDDPKQVRTLLKQLGLAEHRSDGALVATADLDGLSWMDSGSWHDGAVNASISLYAGQFNDRR